MKSASPTISLPYKADETNLMNAKTPIIPNALATLTTVSAYTPKETT
jgi:hypothetical protein